MQLEQPRDAAPSAGSSRRWLVRGLFVLLALPVLGVAFSASATATPCDAPTISWDGGGGSTAWGTAANWTGDVLPVSTDVVCIPAAFTGVVVSSGTLSVQSLEARSPLTIAGGSLSLTSTTMGSSAQALTLSSSTATLGGAGNLTVTGPLTWSAGTMSGTGLTTVTSAGSLSLPGTGTKNLAAGRQLVTAGNTSWSGTGTVNAYQSAQWVNSGTVTISTTATLSDQSGAATPHPIVSNSGVWALTGSGSAQISTAFSNASTGSITSPSGTVTLTGGDGGTPSTGAFDHVSFLSGSYTLSSGASFTGPVTVAGATLQVDAPLTVPSGAAFTVSNGTLSGAGDLLVQGTLALTGGGTQAGTLTGTGAVRVGSGGTLSLAVPSATDLRLSRPVVNDGTITLTASNSTYRLALLAGSSVTNNGLLQIQSANAGLYDGSGATTPHPYLVNNATGTLSAGANPLTVPLPLSNAGTVTATTGTVTLTGGDGGTPATGAFDHVNFLSGSYTLGSGASFAGPITIAGATVQLNAPVTVPTGSALTVSNGTLTGAGDLLVHGSLALTGSGSQAGTLTGTGTARISSGATMTLAGPSATALTLGRPLINDGTISWTTANSTFPLRMLAGSSVTNDGLFQVQTANAGLTDASGASTPHPYLVNSSTGTLSTGANPLTVQVPLSNAGTVTATSGTVTLFNGDGGTPSAGAFDHVSFFSGNYTLSTGASFAGPVSIAGATVQLNAPVTVPTGTTLTVSNGTVTGTGDLLVQGTMALTGAGSQAGSVSGAGAVRVAAGGTLTLTVPSATDLAVARPVINDGTIGWTAANSSFKLSLLAGSSLTNNGLLQIQSANAAVYDGSGPATPDPYIVNSATGTISTGVNPLSVQVPLSNAGTITSTAGTVSLLNGDGGTASTGAFDHVNFAAGSYTLASGARLGAATTQTGSTVLTAQGDVAVTATGAFTLAGGTLTGSDTVSVLGAMSWTGGAMTGTGTTQIAPGATLTVNDATAALTLGAGRQLVNFGAASWAGSNHGLTGQANAVLRNWGSWTSTGTPTLSDGSAGGTRPRLVNYGTWQQSSGSSQCGCDLDNHGTVQVDAGTLAVTGSLVNYDAARRQLNGGRYVLTGMLTAPGLDIATLAADLTLSGTGKLADSTAASALRNLAAIRDAGALTLTAGASLSTPAGLVSSGQLTLASGSTLTVPGSYTQTAGVTTVTDPASTLTATGGVQLTGGTLTGAGTISGNLSNQAGQLTPGGSGSRGTLTVTGTFSQGPAGELDAEVAPDGHDRLAVGSTAALDGTLAVQTTAGYTPSTGTAVALLSYTSRTGHFAAVTGVDLGNGTRWWLTDPGTELDATVQPSSVGDFATVTINGGAPRTKTTQVTLAITGAPTVTVSGMRIGNDTDPTGAFTPYAASSSWTLGPINGTRTVRVQLRDDLGNLSTISAASILLDTVAPTATITAPTSATGPVLVTFSEPVTGVTTANVVLQATAAAGTNLSATLSCTDSTGATVNCSTGPVTTVTLQATGALLPQVSYTVTVNPTGAPSPVQDLAGNTATTTSKTFNV